MTLQERLRKAAYAQLSIVSAFPNQTMEWEAADALDAHLARIRELEGALREIAKGMRGGQIMYASECRTIAREALK